MIGYSKYVTDDPIEAAVLNAWNELFASKEEGEAVDVGEITGKLIAAVLKAQIGSGCSCGKNDRLPREAKQG